MRILSHTLQYMLLGLLLLVGCNLENKEQGKFAVIQFTPTQGPRSGGVQLNLTGDDLQFTSQVTVGGKICTDLMITSPTSLKCTLPANPAGEASVMVRNLANNVRVAPEKFEYLAGAQIDSVSPNIGPTIGGTLLTINGARFTDDSIVNVGGVECENVSTNLARTQITCTTKPRPAGLNLDVTVIDNTGDEVVRAGAFTYASFPTITSVSPVLGPSVGGGSLTISGFSFPATAPEARVLIGSNVCPITAISSTSITCTVPDVSTPIPSPGVKDVRVELTSNTNQFGVRPNAYTYFDPVSVTSVQPANGSLVGGQLVTLTGTNFSPGMTVTIGAVPCTSVTLQSSTSLTCLTGPRASSGLVNAVVSHSFGGPVVPQGTLSNAYHYRGSPIFVSVTPTEIASKDDANDDTIAVTVTDAYTITPGDLRVFVNGQACTDVSLVGSVISCNPPDRTPNPTTPQLVSLQVINPDGETFTQPNALTYLPVPTVTSVVRSSGPLAGLNAVVVNGFGFTTDTQIEFELVPGPGTVGCAEAWVSATQINCTVAAPSPALTGATVTNVRATNPIPGSSPTPIQTSLLSSGYTFSPAPTITGTSPVSVNPAGGTAVLIDGTGFFAGNDFAISIGGTPCALPQVVSPTQVRCPQAPAGIVGPATIVVTNGDGQTASWASFSYKNPPVITGVTNAQGPAVISPPLIVRETFSIGVTNFDALGVGTVTIGGVDCPVVSNNGTTVVCTVPNLTAPQVPPMSLPVVLKNADGQVSTQVFNYNYVGIPSILSLDTTVGNGNNGIDTTVTITGSNFSPPLTSVTLDGRPCAIASVTTNTIVCDVTGDGSSSATPGSVVVTQDDGLVATNSTPGFRFRRTPDLVANTTSTTIRSVETVQDIVLEGNEIYSDALITLVQGGTTLTCTITSINTVPNPDQITCSKPATTVPGVFEIRVVNPGVPDDDELLTSLTLINDPVITGISPSDHGMAGDVIRISGTHLDTDGTLTVGGVACSSLVIDPSETFMDCTLPAGTGTVLINFTNEAGISRTRNFTYIAAPTISSITPSFGPASGGTAIEIAGSGFEGVGWTVSLGGAPCTVTSVASNLIKCTTTARAAGEVNAVVALTVGVTATAVNGFRYLDPPTPALVSPITPTSLPQTDTGTSRVVTVTTSGYFVGIPVVSFGGAACTGVSIVGPANTSLTCTVAAHPTGGDVSVTITNGDGQSVTTPGIFTFNRAPTITSVSPSAGMISGGTGITVTGTNILAGARVYLHSVAPANECAPAVLNLGAQTISCPTPNLGGLTPAGTQTAVNVIVVNTVDSQQVTRANGFTYQPAPVITSVEPELYGPVSGGNQLKINGNYFYPGVLVTINGTICGPVVRESVNLLRCNTAPAPGAVPGSYQLRVFNTDNQEALGTYHYVESPTITGFNRNTFLTGGNETLVINGSGFRTGVTVKIGTFTCAVNPLAVSDSQIQCQTPPVFTPGAQTVTVTNLNGQNAVASNALFFNAPLDLTFITPNSGPASGGNTISLSGSGFFADMAIIIGGQACNAINVVSSNLASCSPQPLGAGMYDVTVTTATPAQTDTLTAAYSYRAAPTITNISPSIGSTAGGTAVTITGTNFVAGSVATIGGINCTSISSLTATSFNCVTPARSAGSVNVFVRNPDNQMSPTSVAFTYNNPPAISSVSPNFGPVAGGTMVTINGAHFVAGATITVGGIPCITPTVNPTTITCTTQNLATSGLKNVVVTNVDTQTGTLANSFTALAAPTLSNVSPLQSLTSGGITVRFTGSNFVTGSIASIGGTNCSSTIFISSTALDCVVPAGVVSAGLALAVNNPDGQAVTGAQTFEYVSEPRLEWVVGGISPTPPNPDNYGTTSINIMHTYTLKNVGTQSSGAITVSILGVHSYAYMIHTNSCTGTLVPQQTCTVKVTFVGSNLTSGTYTATLRATSPAGGTTENVMQGTRQ